MDRLESMQALVAVVEAGSLSAAARKSQVPLATMSRRVAELERYLKTQLLTRTSRKLKVTEAGLAYHRACKDILDQIAEAERSATGEYSVPRGELVLTAPVGFGRLHVLPIVTEFLNAYAAIAVRLLLVDRVANLVEDKIDVAVRIGELPDSNMVGLKLGTLDLVVCGSPTYFAARGRPKQPADLGTHDCIAFTALSSPEVWRFQLEHRKCEVPIRARLVVNTAEAAIDAAVAGLGVARVFSYQSQPAERAGRLTRVLRPFEPATTPVHLVYSRQHLVPAKLRAFIEFAVPRLRRALAS